MPSTLLLLMIFMTWGILKTKDPAIMAKLTPLRAENPMQSPIMEVLEKSNFIRKVSKQSSRKMPNFTLCSSFFVSVAVAMTSDTIVVRIARL